MHPKVMRSLAAGRVPYPKALDVEIMGAARMAPAVPAALRNNLRRVIFAWFFMRFSTCMNECSLVAKY